MGHRFCANNCWSGKASFNFFGKAPMASADPARRSAMIRFQIQKTKLPTRSAAARRGRINRAAFVASLALIAQMLSACSNLPTTSVAAQYPDLNDPTPAAAVHADELAQLK